MTIKFANIPLFGHMDPFKMQQSLDYSDGIQMALTHLVLAEDKFYAKAYKARKDFNKEFIILDNSLIEMGKKAMNMDLVLEAAGIIGADEVILPDAFTRKKESLQRTFAALEKHYDAPYKFMAVAQGANVEEFLSCYATLLQEPRIDTIGIPKVTSTLKGSDGYSRNFILRALLQNNLLQETRALGKEIHLLGAWSTMDFLFEPDVAEYVRSVDSVLPNWEAMHGRDFREDPRHSQARTPGSADHRHHEIGARFEKLEDNNIKRVKEWLSCLQ